MRKSNITAVFLAAILLAGTFTIASPSFILNDAIAAKDKKNNEYKNEFNQLKKEKEYDDNVSNDYIDYENLDYENYYTNYDSYLEKKYTENIKTEDKQKEGDLPFLQDHSLDEYIDTEFGASEEREDDKSKDKEKDSKKESKDDKEKKDELKQAEEGSVEFIAKYNSIRGDKDPIDSCETCYLFYMDFLTRDELTVTYMELINTLNQNGANLDQIVDENDIPLFNSANIWEICEAISTLLSSENEKFSVLSGLLLDWANNVQLNLENNQQVKRDINGDNIGLVILAIVDCIAEQNNIVLKIQSSDVSKHSPFMNQGEENSTTDSSSKSIKEIEIEEKNNITTKLDGNVVKQEQEQNHVQEQRMQGEAQMLESKEPEPFNLTQKDDSLVQPQQGQGQGPTIIQKEQQEQTTLAQKDDSLVQPQQGQGQEQEQNQVQGQEQGIDRGDFIEDQNKVEESDITNIGNIAPTFPNIVPSFK
ncbi:MAG: hypothetical protein ACE5SW_09085 [Nitrososphaeraceae archaeon]